ncbi:MAG: DNA replication/repair protein RecF [Chloroflexi bacterium]|mgnify:CR=1 FL=1|jgi:DNA replication and repair protein RecF|nr:DNA replication/repair protein RecF [Chloroflexota bacterium]HOE35588.1 DNA replication/repair protein RecF [Anaerolineaceae bacterium]HOT26028.1 DNA replication/repair protein RecF [Anaerolineaceae bacterium]HQH58292.1 DNA replication/repair protein RecF [Anaerolineaceae bacterium]HQK02695.1 DNA replication/repair protein RecF [Anaerolineaceae bacterium]
MHLTRLALTNFRIFSRLDLQLPKKVILLAGSNAQGKTTILEAVAYLATFSSFFAAADRQLLNFNLQPEPVLVGRIVGEYQRGLKSHTLEVRLIQEYNGNPNAPRFRKEVLLDGVRKRMGEVFGQFNAVSFLPQMSRIIEGSPSERRQYLDDALSQAQAGYARHNADYTKALNQRNALLKILSERGGDTRQLEVWDEMLARHGAELMRARIRLLKELEEQAAPIHHQLTGGTELLRLLYKPSYEPLPAPKGQLSLPVQTAVDRSQLTTEEIEEGFRKALHAAYREDISRGMTTLGPHRDEFRFIGSGIDLGDYGSRGQGRTALLSLKMAEVQWMRARTGEWPVLLLDEIMAELDPERRASMLTVLSQVEQALLTSTDPDMFPLDFKQNHELWRVQDGMVFQD